MSKIICLFFLLLSILFLSSSTANASHTIDDNDLSIEVNPAIVTQGTKNITVTVKSVRGIFNTNQDYTFKAWHVTEGENTCWDQAAKKPTDANTYIATWNLIGCRAVPGEIKFQIWAGRGGQDRTDSSLIVKDYRFTIEQSGGKLPTLTPLQSPIQLGSKPVVILANARQGNSYTFWWDSSARELAADPLTAANDGNINIPLNLSGVRFQAGDTKKLCMEIGSYRLPVGLTCRFSTSFQFIATPPVDQPGCSVVPASPTAGDSVSLRAIGLEKSQSFRVDVDSAGQTTNLPATTNSGDSGTVVLPLFNNATEGDYNAFLYDSNNERKCELTFKVGARGSGAAPGGSAVAPTGVNCAKDPNNEKCAKSGGEKCPDRSEGIFTAIGCVPTQPQAFVTGIVKFVTAASGGIALLLMILGAIQMITAEGNPENINAAREKFYSAIIGLLFIIFAVLLLQVIGVDILGLPGFTKT